MPFTLNKNLSTPTPGSELNVWGLDLNLNTFTPIDTAFGGKTNISVTGVGVGTYVLTSTQYTPPNIVFSGTLGANLIYQVPVGIGGIWSVFNQTAGGGSITFASGGGGSIVLVQGQRAMLVCDGANMQYTSTAAFAPAAPTVKVALTAISGAAETYMASNSAPALDQSIAPTWTGAHVFANTVLLEAATGIGGSASLVADPGATVLLDNATSVTVPTVTTGANSTAAASTAFVKAQAYATLASPALIGTPTAPTASLATSTTQIATTAFAAGTLGTGTNSGHIVLPSGLIIQWGISTFSSGAGSAITFSAVTGCIAFPNACIWAACSAYSASATAFVASFTATTLTASNGIAGSNSWIAIGN